MAHAAKWLFASLGVASLCAACGDVLKNADTGNDPLDAGVDTGPSAPAVALALAYKPTEIFGGSGIDVDPQSCPAGQALTGFIMSTTPFSETIVAIGGVLGQCGTLVVGDPTSTGYALSAMEGTQLTAVGKVTNDRVTRACPAGQFVVGTRLHGGSGLDELTLECAPLTIEKHGDGWQTAVGTVTMLEKYGGTGGNLREIPCDLGSVATTVMGRLHGSGNGTIVAIGFGCSAVSGK